MSGSGTPMSAVKARLTTEGAVTLATAVRRDSWLAELEDCNDALPVPVMNRAAVVARQATRQDRRGPAPRCEVPPRDDRNCRFLNTRSLLEEKSPKGHEDLPGFSPSVSCM